MPSPFDPPDIPEPDPVLEARLPVKARNLLQRTREAARQWQAHAREARLATRPGQTDTVLDAYSPIPVGLPHAALVTFKLGLLTERDRGGDMWIQARAYTGGRDRNHVEITTVGGGMGLMVRPESNNRISVWPDRWA